MNPKLEELLKLLLQKGKSKEEILEIRNDLLTASYEEFMKSALTSFSDQDLQAIENGPTQEEASKAMRKIYAEKTGNDPQVVMKEIFDRNVTELLAKYASVVSSSSMQEDNDGIVKAQDALHAIANESKNDLQEAAKLGNWQ
jgi:hypothetical protein